MRRKNIFLLTIAFILTGNTYSQWISENSLTKDDLNSIALLDSIKGWIVGDNGTMLFKNKDGWTAYEKITDEDLMSVCLIDSNNGWAVGSKGIILNYDGSKWKNFESPTKERLYSVSFSDASNGVAVGSHGTIIIYDGVKWSILDKATRGNLFSVASKEGMSFIVGGLECLNIPVMILKKSTDYKLSNSYDPDFIELKGICVSNQTNVWAVGNRGAAFHFDGLHWEKSILPDRLPSLNSVYFSTENNGVAVGNSGTILLYSEAKWVKENSSVKEKLNGASAYGDIYYAVGNKGTILSYRYKSKSDFTPFKGNLKSTISSYPNPSADYINIILPENDNFSTGVITITNNYGQVILSEKLGPNLSDNSVRLNTSKFASGLYIIQITSPGWSASGKFVVKH